MQSEALRSLGTLVASRFPDLTLALGYGSGVVSQERNEDNHGKHLDSGQLVVIDIGEHQQISSKDDRGSSLMNTVMNVPKRWLDTWNRCISAKVSRVDSLMRIKQTDMIFVVDDPIQWHRMNLKLNGSDYSWFARWIGPTLLCRMQEWKTAVWYHPFIVIEDDDNNHSGCATKTWIKYGVISRESLMEDLLCWKNMYVCGRLHKPVSVICAHLNAQEMSIDGDTSLKEIQQGLLKFQQQRQQQINDDDKLKTQLKYSDWFSISSALLINWDFAVRIALSLIISEQHQQCQSSIVIGEIGMGNNEDNNDHLNCAKKEECVFFELELTLMELMEKIVSLSYSGDIRTRMGTDAFKISDIAQSQFNDLWQIYSSILLDNYVVLLDDDNNDDDDGSVPSMDAKVKVIVTLQELLQYLPQNVQCEMEAIMKQRHFQSEESALRVNSALNICLSNIVSQSSRAATIKGFFSAGPVKSIRYVIAKYWKSYQRKSHSRIHTAE